MTSSYKKNYIAPYVNGKFIDLNRPEKIFHLHNPANPNDILGSSGWNKEFIDPIVEGMRGAQKKFQLLNFDERMQYLMNFIRYLCDNQEEVKSQMMLELSRSRFVVEEEWQLCQKFFKIFPEFCKQSLSIKKEDLGWEWSYAPLGLILISTNVSFPLYSLISNILPALIAGNAVCVKPSPHCLLSASMLASCFHQASLPAGLVQFVYGDFEVFRRLLLTHQFDTVLCASSEEYLEQIKRDASSQQNIRLVLCSGGKNAAYVTNSAKMEDTIQKVIYGSCADAGQRLESTGLVFVDRNVLDEFQEKFTSAIKQMPIGAREDLSRSDMHVMEPLCSNTAWERFLRFQNIAARESDETLRWGKPIDNLNGGLFVSPGVHLMSRDKIIKSVYASSAFFAPDVCLVPVDSQEEAVESANSLPSIRSFSVYSQFSDELSKLRKQCLAPTLLWNFPTTEINPLLPHVGKGNGSGGGYITGLHFLLATVYTHALKLLVLFLFLFCFPMHQIHAKGTENPVVVFTTSMGTIEAELFKDKDPTTVNNFLYYVKTNYYNNTIFHRIIDGFVIQGGAYNLHFQTKPGAISSIINQSKLGLKNTVGTLAMARKTSEPDSATSQFFINLADNKSLNYSSKEAGYAVFGRVINGLDVVFKIARIKVGQREGMYNVPFYPEEAVIKTVTLKE